MPTKHLNQLLVISTLVLLVLSLVWGLHRLFSLAMLLGLCLYYFSPSSKKYIIQTTQDICTRRLGLTTTQYTLLGSNISYFIEHYLLIGSIVYLLISARDYVFSNILFLPSRLVIWVLIISLLVSLRSLSHSLLYLGERKLQTSDLVFLVSIIIVLCLLVSRYADPFYTSYFYASLIGELVRVCTSILLGHFTLTKLFKTDLFWIWTVINGILLIMYVWNIFPSIKHSLTIEHTVYQTGYIYGDCPEYIRP